MEYRCLFKAAQEKVYTSNYYQKKKKTLHEILEPGYTLG